MMPCLSRILFLPAAALFAVFSILPVRAMEIERVTSPGGIEAWLVSEPTIPMLNMNFAFAGGSSQDPADRPGVANMLSTLLDEGAGEYDARAFQERLSELAIQMSFSATRDHFYGELKTLTDNRGEAFEMLRLALNEPRFEEEAVERMRAALLAGLRRELQEPNAVAGRRWSREVFGEGHPYGRPTDGTLESVEAITIEEVKALREDTFARDNLTVAVVGDIDAETLGPLLDEVFGDLPEAPNLEEVPEAELPDGVLEETVAMNIPQTVITFGRPGLKRDDEDFIPAYLVNHILGGGTFTSRLYREVRESRGLAYSVYTYLYPLERAGLFAGGTATRADRAAESLKLIREGIERMAEEGPSEEELADAKRYLTGAYPLRFDSSGKIARQLVEIQIDDLGIDYVDRRNGLIEAVTIEDAKRAAQRLLGDGSLYVTAVGQVEDVEEAEPAADGG